MDVQRLPPAPNQCPSCAAQLMVTRLQCPKCGTEVSGAFSLGQLASLREPHASLIGLFLRTRGNLKEMERALGLSYPTVRARVEEAFAAAGLDRPGAGLGTDGARPQPEADEDERRLILGRLERGEITATEAAALLRALQGKDER